MNAQKALRVVNLCLALDFLVVALLGIFHELVPWELFSTVHPVCGFLLVALVGIHIFLNRKWIVQTYLKKRGPKADK